MKKLLFSLLAMSLLSTTVFAGGVKPAGKEHHKKTCTAKCAKKDCPKMMDCPMPGCMGK